MSLVFAAIVPHSPILIPSIGKDNFKKIKKTQVALQELEGELYLTKPDCLIVISPHGKIMPDAFSFNLSPRYKANFKEFGDFQTKLEFKSDLLAIQQIRAANEFNEEVPIILFSNSEIDHGTSVPLFYLAPHLKDVPIMPVYYSGLDNKLHYKFGEVLNSEVVKSDKRIAVLASGELSHCLTKKSPGKFSKNAKIFDEKIIEFLTSKKNQNIINMDPELIRSAGECGLKSIIILLGILKNFRYKPELLSYEAPFGIGYLTFNFRLA